jgi:hypothetical protein
LVICSEVKDYQVLLTHRKDWIHQMHSSSESGGTCPVLLHGTHQPITLCPSVWDNALTMAACQRDRLGHGLVPCCGGGQAGSDFWPICGCSFLVHPDPRGLCREKGDDQRGRARSQSLKKTDTHVSARASMNPPPLMHCQPVATFPGHTDRSRLPTLC